MTTNNSRFTLKSFQGRGKMVDLACKDGKIIVPGILQKRLVQWYHEYLIHPGETRTEQTLRQHYWWKGLRKDVHTFRSKCHVCQKTKRSTQKYGKLPEKEAETEPWE